MTDGTGFCDKPDRDSPGTRCGYPMPCPFHTFVIDEASGIILVPECATPDQRKKVRKVGDALIAGLKEGKP